MSRQSELMAISESRTSKRFRFYLQNASKGNLQLRYAPGGWQSAKFELKRNERYMGLFRSLSFNELTFHKDGRDFIRDVYELQGINALITFTVYRWDDTTQTYTVYYTGKVDLSTYNIAETGVKVQIIDTSFAEKVKNRENTKVNLRERISIEGYEVPEFAEEDPVIEIPAYEIVSRAVWSDRLNNDSNLDNHYAALWLEQSDYTEAQHQDPDYTPTLGDGKAMFENALADYAVTLNVDISGRVQLNSYQVKAMYRLILYVNGAQDTVWTFEVENTQEIVFSVIDTVNFTVTTGNRFYLQGSLTKSGTTYYDHVAVDMAVVSSSVGGATVLGYPYYEALLRTLQLITDDNDVLQSEKFGRTDSEIVTYASDGEIGHITKGYFIRGATGLNATLSLNFAELFNSLCDIFMLGMGIETVSGREKVVIENLSYFFPSDVVLDLSSRIREAAIEKEVIPTKHYNQVEVGYNSFEYLTVGGLAEYNTKMSFSTVISVIDNKLDLVGKYRADTQGIVNLRANGASLEDVKGDEDVFVLDSIRKTPSGFVARTDEGFTTVTGGADAANSFNLRITPKRNLLRNGAMIRAGLERNLGTYLRWQAGDKNTALATQLTTETEVLKENADVLVNDLEQAWFYPEYYKVTVEMRYSDLSTILANPKGLIKLATDKYGWIWSLQIGQKENKAEITLLRANLNVITPT